MPENMVELKKNGLGQVQSGDWKASFTLQAADMPDYLLTSPMGKRFYVVFVDADDYDAQDTSKMEITDDVRKYGRKFPSPEPIKEVYTERTEGEKLRTRAVLLCKDSQFQDFAAYNTIFSLKAGLEAEEVAKKYILRLCRIDSRGELASRVAAQIEFEELLERYKDWQAENQYSENLNRY